jgi:hypothetical protein
MFELWFFVMFVAVWVRGKWGHVNFKNYNINKFGSFVSLGNVGRFHGDKKHIFNTFIF